MLANGPWTLSSSRCSVWCSRSILPVKGGAGLGQPLEGAVLAADPLGQYLGRAGLPEPAGELLAVVSEHFARNPAPGHRGGERQADRPSRRLHHHGRDDAEPRVVVDSGDDLALAAVG